MGEPITEVIREARGEDLCLGLKPAESARMNDAVTVAGIFAAIWMWLFRVTASAGVGGPHGPRYGSTWRFDGRNLRRRFAWGRFQAFNQDFGVSISSPRSASSATEVLG